MVNSKRNKKDGFTVFGLKNSVDFSGKLNNDFIINFNREKEEIVNIDTDSGKVFEIKFNKKKKEYTLYFINPKLYLYYNGDSITITYQSKDSIEYMSLSGITGIYEITSYSKILRVTSSESINFDISSLLFDTLLSI